MKYFKIRFNITHIVGLELTKESKHIEGVVLSNLSYIAIKRVFLAKNGKNSDVIKRNSLVNQNGLKYIKIRFNTTHIVGLELTKEIKHIEGVVLSNLSYIAIKRVFFSKKPKNDDLTELEQTKEQPRLQGTLSLKIEEDWLIKIF